MMTRRLVFHMLFNLKCHKLINPSWKSFKKKNNKNFVYSAWTMLFYQLKDGSEEERYFALSSPLCCFTKPIRYTEIYSA